jgi:hypothetical protein
MRSAYGISYNLMQNYRQIISRNNMSYRNIFVNQLIYYLLLFHFFIWHSRSITSKQVLYSSEYTSFRGHLKRFVVLELVE